MPTKTLVIEPPNEKQKLFLQAKTKHVAFGGARGGGKSWAVRTKAKLLATQHKGIKILIIRKTYPELMNNHVNVLIPELNGIASYNRSEKEFRFFNGSIIKFGYCASDADLTQYQGSEHDIIFIDEACNLTEYQLKIIAACCRGTNSFPKRIYYTCNPSGVGMQYIKRLFVDRKFEENENPDDYTFIQSLVTDNDALMRTNPDYIAQLESLPSQLREGWLHGKWDAFIGQYFSEWSDKPEHYKDRKWTHVIEPFDIPGDWTIYRSFDWGYAKPFSVGWYAIDHDGIIYRILEWYGCTKNANEGLKLTAQEVFEEVHRIETQHEWLKGKRINGVADPAIWNAEYGESIAETAAKNFVFFSKGDHQRLAGWMQCRYRLQFDENGYPMFYCFKTCKHFMRTIPSLMFDDKKCEDLDTEGEDHQADEWRYLCMARVIRPRRKIPENKYNESPLSYALDIPEGSLPTYRAREKMEIIDDGT